MENKFCIVCGSELIEHKTGRYNQFNGKELIGKHCPNLQCEEGCDYAGHQWGSFWKMQHETCKRCGYKIIDY